jgi:hypothetical protein
MHNRKFAVMLDPPYPAKKLTESTSIATPVIAQPPMTCGASEGILIDARGCLTCPVWTLLFCLSVVTRSSQKAQGASVAAARNRYTVCRACELPAGRVGWREIEGQTSNEQGLQTIGIDRRGQTLRSYASKLNAAFQGVSSSHRCTA